MRISVGVIPSRNRSSSGMSEWVIAAGCEASVSVPPRLTASLITLSRSRTAKASASPPLTSKLKVEPGLLHWRSKTGRSGWPPGKKSKYQTDATFGCVLRKSATLHAPSAAAVILSFKVSSERISNQPVCGSHIVPRIVRMPRIGSRSGRSQTSAGDQVGMPADIFSKRRDDQISTMCQRGLIDRPQHRIVNDDNRPLAIRSVEAGHDLPGTLEIHHSVCGVCWRFDVKRPNRPLAARRADGFFHRPVAALAKKGDRGHTELRQDLLQ